MSKNKNINDSMNEVKDIGYSFCKEKGVRQHNSDLPIIDKMTTIWLRKCHKQHNF